MLSAGILFTGLARKLNFFASIKQALTTAAVLVHVNPERRFFIAMDASKYALEATFSKDAHPIAFLSHNVSETASNLDTNNQEILAIMIALRTWSPYLRG